jgi:mRNA-degrading endonuclease HigB of HigAB toxin-antitoxin module
MALNREIKYLNQDFSGFRTNLINYAQTYFPNTYTDFSSTSPGVMFMEMASYVGDVLTYYLNNQVQENFLQYSRQTSNIYDLAYMFGYKPKVTGLATVNLDFYQELPAKTENGQKVPDYSYALYIEENTQISSNIDSQKFIIEDPIDFTISSSLDPTTVKISQISDGEPVYFLLKKTRKATSGTINTTNFNFGAPSEFPTVIINSNNIANIIDVFDDNGNQYYEVDHLAQDLVFDSIKNTNVNDPNNSQNQDTPYILKTKQIQRRFATRLLSENQLQLQFGSGNPNDNDENIIPNPTNVGIGLPFEKSKLTTAYSPTNFIFTNTYGIAPNNTTLTVRYLTGGGVNSNVNSNTLTIIDNSSVRFLKNNLTNSTANYIFGTISVNNTNAAVGGKDGDTIEEIRQNSISNYSSQLRNVTADDYLVRSLSMPPRYGVIAKAHVQKPKIDDYLSSLDIYVLSYNSNKTLQQTSSTLKNNLKTYLNQYRMIGDTISIKDAYVINIGCNFELITLPNYNNNEVLIKCINTLKDYFNIDKWQINQPIILRDIQVLLDNIQGVQTVKKVEIINKAGTTSGYSKYAYDIKGATQNGVIYPSLDPSIFELKYLNQDIKGKVVTI